MSGSSSVINTLMDFFCMLQSILRNDRKCDAKTIDGGGPSVRFEFQRAAVSAHDFTRDKQSEPGAGRAAFIRAPIEPLKNQCLVFRPNRASLVCDANLGLGRRHIEF